MTVDGVHKLSVQGVSKYYDGLPVLERVNLEVEKGAFCTIVGASGCGKSTFLRMLLSQEPPTRGEIFLDGVALPEEPTPDRGIVFQKYSVFSHLSVAENLILAREFEAAPLTGKLFGSAKRAAISDIDKLLERIGLSGAANKYPAQLSGGMQQRVSLARCLANDPDVILMDEPLGALDALTREKMQSLVLKLWKETGKTIILITHSVEEALLLGERLLVMAPRPGRIHKEYRLPFADLGVGQDLREVKKHPEFAERREEILGMIWDMEEEIMGRSEETA